MATLDQTISHTHEWVLDRVHELTEIESNFDSLDDGYALVQEFSEWLDPDLDYQDVVSLEYIGEGSEYE